MRPPLRSSLNMSTCTLFVRVRSRRSRPRPSRQSQGGGRMAPKRKCWITGSLPSTSAWEIKIAQGWPRSWAKFRLLTAILSHKVGPRRASCAGPLGESPCTSTPCPSQPGRGCVQVGTEYEMSLSIGECSPNGPFFTFIAAGEPAMIVLALRINFHSCFPTQNKQGRCGTDHTAHGFSLCG